MADNTNNQTSPGTALDQNILILTPGSDFVFNFREDQFVWGRIGNDFIVPYNPSETNTRGFNIDVIILDLADEQLFPQLFPGDVDKVAPGFDTVVLGDWRRPYYYDGGFPGVRQFAIITDFMTSQDSLQLYGSKEDYLVVNNLSIPFQGTVTQGSALLYTGQDPDTGRQLALGDLIAFFPAIPEFGVTTPPTLDLNASYFQFQGTTPPPEPVNSNVLQFGTTGIDGAFSSTTDPFGNLYVAGATTGSLGGLNAGSYDAWFAKYDSSGNQVWIRQIGTPQADTALAITSYVTDCGEVNLYVQGTTTGSLAGANEGYQDIWLGKFNGADGDLLWIQQNPQPLPGPKIDNSVKLDVDKDGNIYQAGITVKDNPPGSTVAASDDAWVAKYDPEGNLEWLKTFASTGNVFDETYGVSVSNDGSVYATGWTRGDLGGTPIGAYDIWLAKLDNQGQQEWITKFGTPNYEFTWDVGTDSQNNAYVTGWTRGVFEGDGSGVSKTNSDAFLTKYDSNGNQVWIKQFGTPGDDGLFLGGLAVDANDNIYVTGFTNGDLGGTNAGSYDAWVAKFDSNSNQLWISQFGTSGFEFPSEISVDNQGNVFVTGYTQGSLGSVNAGAFDAWIAKLDANSGSLESFNPNSGYTNPNLRNFNLPSNDNQTFTESLLATDTIDARQVNSGSTRIMESLLVNTLERTMNLAPLKELTTLANSANVQIM